MFSKFLSSALEKTSINKSTTFDLTEELYPTLSFPPVPPAGEGSRSLCARCLSLLSYCITHYGDSTAYKGLEITHSSSLTGISGVYPHLESSSDLPRDHPSCIICIKTMLLFDAARAHVSFAPSLRTTPCRKWHVIWQIFEPDPNFASHNSDALAVRLRVCHIDGYDWSIGTFKMYPDWSSMAVHDVHSKPNLGDYHIIRPLDSHSTNLDPTNPGQLKENFSSTLSKEGIALVLSWVRECTTSHSKCHKAFETESLYPPGKPWFPDRLVQLSGTKIRIVVKSDPSDFPPEKVLSGVKYLSLSHCWGPSPDPSASLGGRSATVLTELKLDDWQRDIPMDILPLTFRDAIRVCSSLGFEYIWIDSLCIIQDSLVDWQAQSSVMADVYKFAWLNIAALSSISDYDGFINDKRDPRLEFGFRASLASILGRKQSERNGDGQKCVLLQGIAKLHWVPEASAGTSGTLTTRAWVYQERALARRTLDFTHDRLQWSCDEIRGDECDIAEWSDQPDGRALRWTLHEATRALESATLSRQGSVRAIHVDSLLDGFDMRWHGCVQTYSACKLTKHSDKLIAISSVARELSRAKTSKDTYLAGLWDVNLVFQLAWITMGGRQTPPRKRAGMEGYVAPSWSWASIEAAVQPRFIRNNSDTVALADVRASKVELETDFEYGSVKGGWIRLWGRLNSIKGSNLRVYNFGIPDKEISLTDEATGESFWFCSDTVESFELLRRSKDIKKLKWMPLKVRFDNSMVNGFCLCLIEVESAESARGAAFSRRDEKTYRRIGTGNFGRIPSMVKQDSLLMNLGTYPDSLVGSELAKGFKRSEVGFQEFVLV